VSKFSSNTGSRFSLLNPTFLGALFLFAVTLAVFGPSLNHLFITTWDDNLYVTGNPDILGFSIEHLKAAFSKFYVGNYAPLQIVSYMLDYSLWGMNPAGFVGANIMVHALNGMLYYRLILKLTGELRLALFSACIFLLHPVQVETVLWISQRKSLLAMFFFLVALLAYVCWRDKNSRHARLWYALSLAAFVCALFSKSVVVILPAVLFCYDFCFLAPGERVKWQLDKIPYLAAALALALIALKSQGMEQGGGMVGYLGGSPLTTFYTMLTVFVRYAWLLFWPARLNILYFPQTRPAIDGAVAASALLMLFCCLGLWRLYLRDRRLFFWAALAIAGILPVAQIVPLITLMNDRYLYFPLLGGALLFAYGVLFLVDRVARRPAWAGTLVLSLLLLPLPLLSWQRSRVWHDPLTLWSDASAKTPNFCTWAGLGNSLMEKGDIEEAKEVYRKALASEITSEKNFYDAGLLSLEALADYPKAVQYLRLYVRNFPRAAAGYRFLGLACLQTGDTREGEAALRRSLQLEPDNGLTLRGLGHDYERGGSYPLALSCYREALLLAGETPELDLDLARIYGLSNRPAEGLPYLEKALNLGFRDAQGILQDPALASLRALPGFLRLLPMLGGR
jgi:tetratricopeptide (TPR) repeat protein